MTETNLPTTTDGVEIKTTTELLEQRQAVLAIAAQYGYSGSIAPDVLEENIRQSSQRIGMEMIAIGASLKMLKLQCGHGEFMTRVERAGFAMRSAQKMMLVAEKFSNTPTSAHLVDLGKSKVLELAIELDQNEVDQLMSGEEVRGITADDVRLMTVRELREALQAKDKEIADAKANYEARGKVLENKQKQIDDMAEKLAKKQFEHEQVTQEQVGKALREALTLAGIDALSKVSSLKAIITDLQEHGFVNDTNHEDFISGVLLDIQTAISAMRETYNIKAMPTGDVRPDWITRSQEDLDAMAQAQLKAAGFEA
jgi:hypothetical protein